MCFFVIKYKKPDSQVDGFNFVYILIGCFLVTWETRLLLWEYSEEVDNAFCSLDCLSFELSYYTDFSIIILILHSLKCFRTLFKPYSIDLIEWN